MARSLWLDRASTPEYPSTPPASRVDAAVVGGGLTGLVTALLLARSGMRVTVLEARRVGAVTTGNTTAKISLLQGTRLSTIRKKHPPSMVEAYVEANREGQQWLLRYCEEHGIPVQIRPAYTYATSRSGRTRVRKELEAAQAAGLGATWDDDIGLPFQVEGAIRLDGQVQFDPMDAVTALTADIVRHGGTIAEQARVTGVKRSGGDLRVRTGMGEVRTGLVILATGIPILDRGGFFARLEPQRSYAAAFQVDSELPQGMYLSADSPTRSIRTTPGDGGELLLIGGNGHVVGRHSSPRSLVDDLTDWTKRAWPSAVRTHWWSAQDYQPIDGLPYVGPVLPRRDDVLMASGYAKWGMTNAVAAGLALSAHVLGGHVTWAEVYRSWRTDEVRGAATGVKLNATVGLRMVQGWSKAAATSADPTPPAEGSGRVERQGARPVGVCTVGGQTHRVSAICPHLRGIVTWNDAELSWDCPLHGSRFTASGELLEGPATTGLSAV